MVAAWKALWLDFVTSSLGSASAVQEHLVSAAMDVRQVTGASPAADPASVMDMQTSATREPDSASTAGTIREEKNVKGDAPTGRASFVQQNNYSMNTIIENYVRLGCSNLTHTSCILPT